MKRVISLLLTLCLLCSLIAPAWAVEAGEFEVPADMLSEEDASAPEQDTQAEPEEPVEEAEPAELVEEAEEAEESDEIEVPDRPEADVPNYDDEASEALAPCGRAGSIYWELVWNESRTAYTLNISGTGRMHDYGVPDDYDDTPWYKYVNLIEAINVEEGITYVSTNAFSGCKNAKSVTFASSVTAINASCFTSCSSLTQLDLNRITSIEGYGFRGCSSLLRFAVAPENPAFCTQDGVLFSKDGKTLMYCPPGLSGSYTAPAGVTAVSPYAFYYCAKLTEVNLPEVRTLSNYAFSNCSALQRISFPAVESIGNFAFYYCSALRQITLPDSLRSIGSSAFYYCKLLTQITLPRQISKLENSTFHSCTGLQRVEHAAPITQLGSNVFQNCTSLQSFTLDEGLTTIPSNAFNGCSALSSIVLPTSITKIENAAFTGCEKLSKVVFLCDKPSNISPFFHNEPSTFYYPAGKASQWEVDGDWKDGGLALSYKYYEITLVPITLDDCTLTLAGDTVPYSGADTAPALSVRYDGVTLPESAYTVSCTPGENGTVEVTVSSAIFTGALSGSVTVTPRDLSTLRIACEESYPYTGSAVCPAVVLTQEGKALTGLAEGTDYTVTFEDNTAVGTASVLVSGMGNCTGSVSGSFVIVPCDLASLTLALAADCFPCDGTEHTPAVLAQQGDVTLTEGTDYSVRYQNNVETGTAQAIVTGMGNYSGEVTLTFTIAPAVPVPSISYLSNTAKGVKVVWKETEGVDSYILYRNNANIGTFPAGTLSYVDTGATTNNYKYQYKLVAVQNGVKSDRSITKGIYYMNASPVEKLENTSSGVKITWAKVSGATGYNIYRDGTIVYTAKGASTVTWTDKSANANGTVYEYKVTAYKTVDDRTYNGVPSAAKSICYLSSSSISTVTNTAAGSVTLTWAKNGKATGYKVQYSTSSDFSSNVVTKTISTNTNTLTLTGLKKGTTYYFRVLTLRTTASATYQSALSAAKSTKVSK